MKINYFDEQAWWIIVEYIWIQFSTLINGLKIVINISQCVLIIILLKQ